MRSCPPSGLKARAARTWNSASLTQPTTLPGFSVSSFSAPVESVIRCWSKNALFRLLRPTSTWSGNFSSRSTPLTFTPGNGVSSRVVFVSGSVA
jgi:hypothetical protein